MIDAERQVVSEIGAPIEEPNLTLIRLRKGELAMTQDISSGARAIAERELQRIGTLWRDFLAAAIAVS